MRAAVMHAYGVPEDLKIEEVPDPVLKPGCVIVDVKASSVNFPDVLIIANKYQVTMPLPLTPGSEFAGVVSAVAEGVDNLKIGDRVMGATFVGAFAEKVLAPMPKQVSGLLFWVQPVELAVQRLTSQRCSVAK
jgi:NADPH2:quinone reductase